MEAIHCQDGRQLDRHWRRSLSAVRWSDSSSSLRQSSAPRQGKATLHHRTRVSGHCLGHRQVCTVLVGHEFALENDRISRRGHNCHDTNFSPADCLSFRNNTCLYCEFNNGQRRRLSKAKTDSFWGRAKWQAPSQLTKAQSDKDGT